MSAAARIERLPAALSTQLWAGRSVSTYASAASLLLHSALAAGARAITLTAYPCALRLTCVDDGSPRAAPRALAAVASVDVASRGEDGRVGVAEAADGSEAAGMLGGGVSCVTDVWEIFNGLPVRRRAAAAAGDGVLVEEVRLRVVAAALANPQVAFRLVAGDEIVCCTRSARRLGLEAVSALLGGVVAEAMVAVPEGAGGGGVVRVAGFVSTAALAVGGEAQVVSVDGVTLIAGSFVHRTVREAWRRHMAQFSRGMSAGELLLPPASSRRRPAFVLNLYSNVRCADLVFAGDDSADVSFYEPEVVARCLEEAVAAALAQAAGVSRDPVVAMNRRAVAPVKSGFVSRSRTVSKTPRIIKPFRVAARKRATSAIDPDIQAALDELVSPFAGSDSPVAVLPLTAPAARRRAASANVRSGLSLGSAPVLRRPRSASEVQQGFRASAPSWTNPCLASRGTALARAVDAPRAACCPSVDSPALDLRQVRISRADIPHLKVVGQSDRKFIIVVDADAVLYAVDQHAASERAHYELLQRNALQASADGVASGIYAGAPGALTLVTLTTRQAATLALHEAHLQRWGWHVVRLGGLVAALTHEIVTAPHISETGVAVDSAAQLTAHLDGLAGGAVASAVPRPILDALATSACHTAVRFGDALTHAQCVAIVRDLASCDLPFSCAHGRPSIVPLVVL